MKNIIITIAVLFSMTFSCFAQDALEEKDRIPVGVETPQGVENESAAATLVNNIMQALTLNGLSATESRFTILPKVVLLSKNVTGTAPVKYVVEIEVSLFMGDLYTGTVFGQTSFTMKGVGNDETKAYIAAIRNVQARNSKLKTMIVTGKDKIIAYFEADGEQILGRIAAHIERKDYKSAIIEAESIPTACADLYNRASELVAKIPYEEKKAIVVTPTIINNYYCPQESRESRVAVFVK